MDRNVCPGIYEYRNEIANNFLRNGSGEKGDAPGVSGVHPGRFLRLLLHGEAGQGSGGYGQCTGLAFTEEEVLESIKTVLSNGKGGYTSIYADIKNGNRTEIVVKVPAE